MNKKVFSILALNAVICLFLFLFTELHNNKIALMFIIWQLGIQAVLLMYESVPWFYLFPSLKQPISTPPDISYQGAIYWSFFDLANLLFNTYIVMMVTLALPHPDKSNLLVTYVAGNLSLLHGGYVAISLKRILCFCNIYFEQTAAFKCAEMDAPHYHKIGQRLLESSSLLLGFFLLLLFYENTFPLPYRHFYMLLVFCSNLEVWLICIYQHTLMSELYVYSTLQYNPANTHASLLSERIKNDVEAMIKYIPLAIMFHIVFYFMVMIVMFKEIIEFLR